MRDSLDRLWFCLRLPGLGLELFTRGADVDVGARGEPCVLVENNRVIARNEAAEQQRIALGSTLATAHGICHGLRHFVRDSQRERRRLRFLAETVYGFSARVSIQEPDCILLEAGGSLKLFGGLYRLKRELMHRFVELGHRVELGIAGTPLAAIAFARAGHGAELGQWPSSAAVRTDTRRGLERLALEHTELEPFQIERFENMGLRRLGEILRLPTAELGRRFGADVLDYLARLSGIKADPRPSITPAERFAETLELLQAATDKEALAFPMQRLLGELDGWLAARQLGTRKLRWRFAPWRGAAVEIDVELAEAQRDKPALLAISRLRLERARLPAEVATLALSASRLEPRQPRNDTLFLRDRRQQQSPHRLIDHFRARLDDATCHGLDMHDDHRPECAWRPRNPQQRIWTPKASSDAGEVFESWVSEPREPEHKPLPDPSTQAAKAARQARRPIWLLETPRPINRQRLTLLTGPERIETGWWDVASSREPGHDHSRQRPRGVVVRRDYYAARLHDGAYCWVFKDLAERTWFIHGYFS